ncbi:tetratricopeptide repeat protein [Chryseolinea lacunae]|uniref:Tetratricopeptide repeat protein n=1 Tax=Chryseolinea lacunae TaxID=2801331 RepID=A0ABS1KZU3_9BACT|nr:tetratricopeptide repeat protein [Chryseolinea lacunae]MBL0744904.1 tetratricopeptide repeat protein [Chryseolinea lacunae]
MMKRIALLLLMVVTVSAYAQKAVKPNLNKALSLYKEGKLDEAKTMIDLATTYEKTTNDAKTYYYKGLIYAAIDTTSNETYKALAPDAFQTALDAFKKGDDMNTGKEHFVQEASGLPVTKTQQIAVWANGYLNKGATLYQEEDLEGALKNFEKVQLITPKDTTAYFYAGFVSNGLENWDKAESNFKKYMELGGKSPDAYSVLVNINSGPKENKEEALKLVREAKAKFPKNTDFPKVEIGLLIDLKRIDEAKSGLESAVKKEPNNKILHFYLGYANQNLNNNAEAKKNYEEALRIDPKYFEASFYLAKLMYTDAANLKKEMSSLGISQADRKKKVEIDKVLVEKLKVALPYWENTEKLNPSDQEVLDVLYSIYRDLGLEDQSKRIEKRYKELGLEN